MRVPPSSLRLLRLVHTTENNYSTMPLLYQLMIKLYTMIDCFTYAMWRHAVSSMMHMVALGQHVVSLLLQHLKPSGHIRVSPKYRPHDSKAEIRQVQGWIKLNQSTEIPLWKLVHIIIFLRTIMNGYPIYSVQISYNQFDHIYINKIYYQIFFILSRYEY